MKEVPKDATVFEGPLLLPRDVALIMFALDSLRKRKRYAKDKKLQKAVADTMNKFAPLRQHAAEQSMRQFMEQISGLMESVGKPKQ